MNKNIKLAAVLGVLILAVYVYQGPFTEWKNNHGKPQNDFLKVDYDAIDRFEIKANDKDYAITKQDDKWKIDGTKDFYLGDNITESIKTKISEAKDSDLELASNNKDKKDDFNINDQFGTRIKMISNNETVIEFIVGKYTQEGSNFINFPSKPDEVYSIKTDFISVFSDPSAWYDKTVFSSEKEGINHIRFQYPGSEFVIEKNESGKWAGIKPYKFNVNEAKLEKILGIMSGLSSVKVPKQTFAGTGLEKGSIIVQATGTDIDNTIMVGDKDKEGNYYAKKGPSDNIYLITKEQRDELAKKINDFR